MTNFVLKRGCRYENERPKYLGLISENNNGKTALTVGIFSFCVSLAVSCSLIFISLNSECHPLMFKFDFGNHYEIGSVSSSFVMCFVFHFVCVH